MKFVVSIPGLAHTIPMNYFVPQSLIELGHEVIVYNHERDNWIEKIRQKYSKTDFINYKNRQLLDLLDREKPDVFFSIYGRTQNAETIKAIKSRNILTISWWLNDPFELGFQLAPASEYDFYFSNSLYTHDMYRKNGVKNIHFLPVGIDTHTHKPAATPNYKYDILFAGDFHPIREEIIAKLIQNGINISIMGPWNKKHMKQNELLAPHFVHQRRFFSPQEMVVAFQQSKIVLNIHSWLGRYEYGINPRLFEASGCAAFQICDMKQEIPLLFEPNKEIVLYENVEELCKLIPYYLSHNAEREQIAKATYQRAMNEHTYIKRMEKVLEIIKK
jgi:spore maturation protein CgeB